MYFEDEKDIIDDDANLHIAEDGTVSWEDILSEQNEGGVELLDESQEEYAVGASQSGLVDNGGGVASVNNELDPNEIEYTDSISDNSPVSSSSQNSNYTPEEYASEENISDDFDIDKQLEQMSMDDGSGQADSFQMPTKEPKKSNSTIILLALLLALLVMGGIYYYFTMVQGPKEDLVPPSTKTQMDNMTSEDLEARNNEEANSEDDADTQEGPEDLSNAAIPVVNDDEVDTLKAEEPQKEEKKQVIAVIPTGRINPFLPISKYSKADIPETIFRYDKTGIPAPPTTMVEKNEETVKMLSISVSGIMYDDVKPSAIITLEDNDYFVQKGDKLDDYKVVEIGRNYVTVAHGSNLYKANVGEEFKISSKIYGSAQYIPQGQGGGRQYYSVNKEQVAKEKDAKLKNISEARYVSEDEVDIKTKE